MEKKNLNWIKFNRWTVISDWAILMTQKQNWKPQPIRMLKCQCECWTIREIRQWNLVNWSSKSCGCHHKEVCRLLIKELHKTQKWEWNPNWRWWISYHNKKIASEIRISYPSREWSRLVKNKDWWKCNVCKGTKQLQAHHLINFTNEENRFIVDNWITMCRICHNQFHKEYWRFNNTPEQFQEFLSSREEQSMIAS